LGSPELAKDVINYRDIRNYLSIDQFLEKISNVFADSGYNLEIGEVKWFSIFKIQEKISADWFAADGRVILVGDACHTHSPGGGLGMQAGMAVLHEKRSKRTVTLTLAAVLYDLAN
jgi:FAD binding domain